MLESFLMESWWISLTFILFISSDRKIISDPSEFMSIHYYFYKSFPIVNIDIMNGFLIANGIVSGIQIMIQGGILMIHQFPESWAVGYQNYKENVGTIVKIYPEILQLIPIMAEWMVFMFICMMVRECKSLIVLVLPMWTK